MAVRLIALDLDGTLLGPDHATIAPRDREALQWAARQGVTIVTASGRTLALLEEVRTQLDPIHYLICSNGASVRRGGDGALLWEHTIPFPQACALFQVLRRHGIHFEAYADGKTHMDYAAAEAARTYALSPAYCRMQLAGAVIAHSLEEALAGRALEKLDLFYVPPRLRDQLAEELLEVCPLNVTSAVGDNAELSAPEANKGAALAALCARLEIEPEEVMAFGDASNDREMLTWAWWSFAMENGDQAAREAARYQTSSNRDCGVAAALETWLPRLGVPNGPSK